MATIQARRIEKYEDLDDTEYCYYKSDGRWYLYMPGCGLAGLANHTVVSTTMERLHESFDLTTGHDSGKPVEKHGFLEKGIWRDARELSL